MESNAIDQIPEEKVVEVVKTVQSRWKSPVVWTSVALKIVGILLLAGYIDATQGEIFERLIGIVTILTTTVSDFNNPQNTGGF